MRFEGQMTIGGLLRELYSIDNNKKVRFAFGYVYPSGVGSYRGYYRDLALEYTNEGDYPTVRDLIKMLEDAVGSIYHGYKGGEYAMSSNTPIWVANYGEATGVPLVGVLELYDVVVLETALVD